MLYHLLKGYIFYNEIKLNFFQIYVAITTMFLTSNRQKKNNKLPYLDKHVGDLSSVFDKQKCIFVYEGVTQIQVLRKITIIKLGYFYYYIQTYLSNISVDFEKTFIIFYISNIIVRNVWLRASQMWTCECGKKASGFKVLQNLILYLKE